MKKFLSLVVSAALLCTLGVPVLAAEGGTDARLAAVTGKVKTVLGLDTAAYDSFHGELAENMVTPVWQLRWSGKDGSLIISATEEGKILSYDLYDEDGVMGILPYPRDRGGLSLPKLSRAEAQKTAQAFLDRALTPGVEKAVFPQEGRGMLSVEQHYFSGQVLENGLASPFDFSIRVRVSDNKVTSFSLNGQWQQYLGGVPSPTPAADKAKAGESLKGTQKLYLEYVLTEDGKSAVLRYLPEHGHEFYVDAQSGKLVDLSVLRQNLWDRGGSMSGAAPSEDLAEEKSLTEAEQQGVAQLEGVLSKEKLDEAARAVSALGLSKYSLASLSYQVDPESGVVTAQLQYGYKAEQGIYRRVVGMDAKSGAIQSVYSSRPWNEKEKPALSPTQSQAKAEAFLKALVPAQFGKTALYTAPGQERNSGGMVEEFQFAQRENGIFLAQSQLSVGIDAADGSVSYYYNSFVEGLTFQSAEGVISPEQAASAWFSTYQVSLGYLSVPEKLDLSEPRWKPLIEMGQSYLSTRKLAYYLEREGWYLGVDAKTGKAVKGEEVSDPGTIRYSDLSGHWVKAQAETLAQYGVGWQGGVLRPVQGLTQLDMLALLVSTNGYLYDGSKESAEEVYRQAYAMGVLKKAERDDGAAVTRAQLLKYLLESAGYGNIAGLEGIFKVSFADQSAIPARYYGYVAVGQGLGIIKGDKAGNFAPNRTATRAEAVSVVYHLMSR